MDIMRLLSQYPLLNKVKELEEVVWINPNKKPYDQIEMKIPLEEIVEANQRLKRFSPYLKKAFNKAGFDGVIESELLPLEISKFSENLDNLGPVFLKGDHELPIAGSVKARGGVYEVLKHAEDLLLRNHLISKEDDYRCLLDEKYRNFFSKFTLSVGSTGNLGLSIGLMGQRLGFKCVVHMSRDAKIWKKNLLRNRGVEVIEYDSDYSKAVESGRKLAESDEKNYFVDDENSKSLFLGYAVAGLRLKNQLEALSLKPTIEKPIYVYIPCGVGGAPSGIAYGLKYMLGDRVRIYFIEPTKAPCFLLSMVTGLGDQITVNDLSITQDTMADGLAVGKSSALATSMMTSILDGIMTVTDAHLFKYLKALYQIEHIKVEPSAAAGFKGLYNNKKKGIHIIWATGGSFVPEDIFKSYLQ